jgi:hypothetical protein
LSAQVVNLTDTAAGSWQKFGQAVCKVDIADILARVYPPSAGAGASSELLMHSVQNCGLLSEGVGTRSNVVASFSSADRSIHNSSGLNIVDEQSKCLAKSRVQGIANQFSFAGTCNK